MKVYSHDKAQGFQRVILFKEGFAYAKRFGF